MADELFLSIHPQDEPDYLLNLVKIMVTRPDGDTFEMDPKSTQVKITEEHPEVDRMEGDLGAICEVYRQTTYYYLSMTGTQLAGGSRVTLFSKDFLSPVILHVIEIENGKARIDPPAFPKKAPIP